MKRQSGTTSEPLDVNLISGVVTATVTNDGTFATPGKQDTGNTSLASIDTKTPALGQAAMAASSPVVIASNQTAVPVSLASSPTTAVTVANGANVVEGTTTDAAIITDATGTIQQYLRGLIKLAITAGSFLVNATGNIASGSSDSGNPVKVGGQVLVANPSALSTGQRTNFINDIYGRLMTRSGHQAYAGNVWTQIHIPSSNTQATKTQNAGAGAIRNVCTGFTVTLCTGATAPTAIQVSVALIDGSSGGGTYLWRSNISLPAVAGAITAFTRTGLWLPGTAATAMTLEFSAAAGANTFESVSMEGTTVAE